ncbi:MAG TPA: response regulator, partial [Myxococcota bacterium]
EIEEKAEQLALTSKYKSEFLANMSHELRTPLNSLLILSQMLSENIEGNLVPKQVEFAKTIHASGTDLLALINDILDLNKIESGMMDVDATEVAFFDLGDYVEKNFRHVAQQRQLSFKIELTNDLPRSVFTDTKRLQQVLKNLLSNAFKFTEAGAVTLKVAAAREGWSRENELLNHADGVISFSVVDTGIGIPVDKQRIIFEPFQQADGTTSRKYGGTGLGLSISREIARLLGGELRVVSTPGVGSTFTLYLPRTYAPVRQIEARPAPALGTGAISISLLPQLSEDSALAYALDSAAQVAADARAARPQVTDDRDQIVEGDRVLLVIEDDPTFAQIMVDGAHKRGFKAVVAARGETGLAFARKGKPAAITLDMRLADIDGWTVLDQLKHDASTRHIPVEVISGDDQRQRSLRMGAAGFLQKPVSAAALDEMLLKLTHFVDTPMRRLLIVEDDERERASIVALVSSDDIETIAVRNGQEALHALASGEFACMVVDLGLPDIPGLHLLRQIKRESRWAELPIVVYTGRPLERREETEIKKVAEAVIVKDAASPERLLDETALYLHRVHANLPEAQRRMLEKLHHSTTLLAGMNVLIVDDDVRNIFAITSVLERHGSNVLYAENGKDGLAILEKNEHIDAVLMDIMMPEMDGYEAMRRIRGDGRFGALPIIALTAKAMKGDEERCVE